MLSLTARQVGGRGNHHRLADPSLPWPPPASPSAAIAGAAVPPAIAAATSKASTAKNASSGPRPDLRLAIRSLCRQFLVTRLLSPKRGALIAGPLSVIPSVASAAVRRSTL